MNDEGLDDRELDDHIAAIIEMKEKTIILWLNLEWLNTENEYSLYASLLKIHKKVQVSLARIQEWSIKMDAENVDVFYSDCLGNSRINPNFSTAWWTWQDEDELFIIYCWPYFNTQDPRYNHMPTIVINCKSTLAKASVSKLALSIKEQVSANTFAKNAWKQRQAMQSIQSWIVTDACYWNPFYHFEKINTEFEFQMYSRMHNTMKD